MAEDEISNLVFQTSTEFAGAMPNMKAGEMIVRLLVAWFNVVQSAAQCYYYTDAALRSWVSSNAVFTIVACGPTWISKGWVVS